MIFPFNEPEPDSSQTGEKSVTTATLNQLKYHNYYVEQEKDRFFSWVFS